MDPNCDKSTLSPLMRIAVVPIPPMLDVTTDETGRLVPVGTEGIFMDTILKALRFQYELYIQPDGEWGRVLNGNWTGMIGTLLNRQADLAWTWLTVNEERSTVVKFSTSYYVDVTTFGVVKPNPYPPAYTIVYPFDMGVWFAILSVLLLMPLVFIILKVYCSHCPAFLNVFGSILKQPLSSITETTEVRILIASWLLFTTLISFFYSSVLLSFMTKPLEKRHVRTFQELSKAVEEGEIISYANSHSAVLKYILQSDQEYLSSLGKTVVKNKWYTDEFVYTKPLTAKENIAYIYSRFFLQRKNDLPGTRFLIISDDSLLSSNIAVAMREDFCYKERLNTMITRATEAGLFTHYIHKYSLRSAMAKDDEENQTKSLTVSDISGVLFILGVGLVLSTIILVIELVYFRKKSRRTK
ncbi:lig_chan-Glu_bd domain-containing protein [Trichonephila clavata]|uniref:Lig_chan-Glu_bd domain-containing protein n=1 Tax=Trichonephila clavata TaxID=2740835 RepID=A0A8X6LPB9_TRICU|nr:lig_chan-Glu_bd domain-containing protein [Trichonephila clavata]